MVGQKLHIFHALCPWLHRYAHNAEKEPCATAFAHAVRIRSATKWWHEDSSDIRDSPAERADRVAHQQFSVVDDSALLLRAAW